MYIKSDMIIFIILCLFLFKKWLISFHVLCFSEPSESWYRWSPNLVSIEKIVMQIIS